jgi:hypothetical protein
MGTNFGFKPLSPSEMATFLRVPMAHGKARFASGRNAAQHLCIMRTYMDTSFTPVDGFEAGRWEHVGAGIRLL